MDQLHERYNEDTIFYNEEKHKFDIEIPLRTQAAIFSNIVALDFEKIIKKKKNKPVTAHYAYSGSNFSYRLYYYYFEKDGSGTVSINLILINKKENIVYELTFIIQKSGTALGIETLGYSQESLFFLDELLTNYINFIKEDRYK